MRSPFRFPGGKFYGRKKIMPHIPQHSFYVEPFAGGASIFFAKNKVKENWLNDKDQSLINCFRIIRDRPEELIKSLEGEKATKEKHSFYKNEFRPSNKLEEAQRWFYLNRTSYSGIMKEQNCYWGYGKKYSMPPENWPKRIRKVSKKLQDVKLSAWDFERVLEKVPKNSFLFIDPPYFNADQDKFYPCSFDQSDHLRLQKVLKEAKDRFLFLMTYDNCEEIKDLYDWAPYLIDEEWNYTINRTDNQRKNGSYEKEGSRYKGKEIFILNYKTGLF